MQKDSVLKGVRDLNLNIFSKKLRKISSLWKKKWRNIEMKWLELIDKMWIEKVSFSINIDMVRKGEAYQWNEMQEQV